MKYIVTYILLILVFSVSAQTINQLDENGKQHGVWKKNFDGTNILRFEGEFHHGKEIGLFRFYQNINGKAVLAATREFLEPGTKANVTFFASTGKLISEGQMNGKTYVGEWKYYQKDSNKLLTLEHFDDSGNLTGERFIYYTTGQVSQKENYKKGKLDGISVWYSEDNVVIKEYTYVDGVLHGPSKFYDPKGQLIAEGFYKKDQKDGIWKYYENGKLIKEKKTSN
ncbi:toxin-antitoxin system YwqK family antitoxin [Confluentibacter flavum]|uniref:Preprotein translocase YidC n=1 Tax=Confluentibacter flavum TaxID=1909700 RepID=A0A2N3HIQ9_9FLAO|nr:preprotein translocase YidC [Confluentibacter flavum]PKQ44831.1 preprotein translocase YidC [Confluentibacter flavum]